MNDDGEAAIQRERDAHEEADRDTAAARFRAKMREMRAEKSIPSYTGPRAARP